MVSCCGMSFSANRTWNREARSIRLISGNASSDKMKTPGLNVLMNNSCNPQKRMMTNRACNVNVNLFRTLL